MSTPRKVALVTGASSGIGRAIAAALGERGFHLVLVSRRPAAAAGMAARYTPPPCFLSLDVTDVGASGIIRSTLERLHGGLDVLVHAAGVLVRGPIESLPLSELDRLYQTNLRAPLAITQALLPLLRTRTGEIIFINSTAAVTTPPMLVAYAALKHALRSLADGLRQEVNPSGIRVTSVFPGRTATPMQAALQELEGREYLPASLLQPEDVATAVLSTLDMPRSAEVTDLRLRPIRP